MSNTLKSIKDLNIIDNFMFNELIMQEEEGKAEEFVRSLLEPIFNKKIGRLKIEGQRVAQGRNTNTKTIQMDAYIKSYEDSEGNECLDVEMVESKEIYNLEPNKYKLPNKAEVRRSRLYHDLIDGNVIKTGTHYEDLLDVYVIFITTYDPFGLDRMVYTIKRRCVEEPNMPYEDGDITLYLYAYGNKDIPSQKLADMLKFVVESTDENAKKAGMDNVNQMVKKIKRNSDLGVVDMQSWEMEWILKNAGREEGRAEGNLKNKIELICKKLKKEKTDSQIADELELDVEEAKPLIECAKECAPEYDEDKIYELYVSRREK